MKRETETELGFWFRFFLMAGNVHHHGNLGEAELVSIFLNSHYTLTFMGQNLASSAVVIIAREQGVIIF